MKYSSKDLCQKAVGGCGQGQFLAREAHEVSGIGAEPEKLGLRYERDVDVFGIHAVLYALARDAFRTARR